MPPGPTTKSSLPRLNLVNLTRKTPRFNLIKMPTKITPEVGKFYHIYNRGVEKRDVFLNTTDKQRFLTLLYLCNGTHPVNLKLQGLTLEEARNNERGDQITGICGYCLMPNHFHILLNEKQVGGISIFMQKLTTAYTMYFNKKNDRVGALFQGTFKLKHADNDEYLKYLISYIHLNPIKLINPHWKEDGIQDLAKTKQFLESYQYSSYHDFLGNPRIEKMILTPNLLPEYFNSSYGFEATTNDWLTFKDFSSKV